MAFQESVVVTADEVIAEGNSSMAAAVDGLTFLILSDDDTGLAGLYTRQLEMQVRGLEALLRSDNPNMRAVRARLWN